MNGVKQENPSEAGKIWGDVQLKYHFEEDNAKTNRRLWAQSWGDAAG
jgi:hypothetical protein